MRFKLWMLVVAVIVAAIAIIVIRMPTVKAAPAQPTTAVAANPHVVYCRHGVLSDDKAACCPSDCGDGCGGAGCTSARPHCCVQSLINAKAYCLDSIAVRCLLPPGAATPHCEDIGQDCNYYKGSGFCEPGNAYYGSMQTNCRKTCGFCVA